MSLLLLSYSWPSPYSALYFYFRNIATTLSTSRFDYCNSLLYSIASKNIAKLPCVQNCLVIVVASHSLLPFLILCNSWNHFIDSLFNLASFSLPIQLFIPGELSYLFSILSLSPQDQGAPFIWFSLLPRSKSVLAFVLFQLLSQFFGTRSLTTLSLQITKYICVNYWKLAFSDLLIPPKFRLHPIICWWILRGTMRLPNSCTRCATEDIDAMEVLFCYYYYYYYYYYYIMGPSISRYNVSSNNSNPTL